jgi:predicted N-acyltransferase
MCLVPFIATYLSNLIQEESNCTLIGWLSHHIFLQQQVIDREMNAGKRR